MQATVPHVNLLLITLDTTRADRIGPWNGPRNLTPNLDELATRSVIFERAYTPVPLTLPSHASLLTGLYPPEHGLRVNSGLRRLEATVPLLTEQLRRQGYRTGAFVGSFVLDRKFGLDRGFDLYDDKMEEAHGPTPGDAHGHKMRIGERVVDAALGWLRQRPRNAFFCWVHLFDAHTPHDARPKLFGSQFEDRPYDAGIAYVDQQVGRLIEELRRTGRDENTVIVVVGDHGESLGEHGERTHGFHVYNATLHVPLMIRWTGPEAPTRRISTPVSMVDLFPTLLSKFDPRAEISHSGQNLWPACLGETLPPRPLYAESNHPLEEAGAAPLRSLVTERWKYIRSPQPELYDLEQDFGETHNLAGENLAQVGELDQRLQELEAGFTIHQSIAVTVAPHELRKLASLGYAGGGAAAGVAESSRPDIKDILPFYNLYTDAQELIGQQQFADAATLLERVVAGAPQFFQAWFNLGVCCERMSDFEAAQAAYQRAVELDANATACMTLGGLYLLQNQPEKSIPLLETSVALKPDSIRALFYLGEAYRRMNRWEDARKLYLDALAIDPEFLPAREAVERLPESAP